MANTIRVTPEKLKATASKFNSSGQQISRLTSKMLAEVASLNGKVWSGDAASAYTKRFSSLQDDIQRMCKMISEHVNDLNAMAKTYSQAETQNRQTASRLTADVIR